MQTYENHYLRSRARYPVRPLALTTPSTTISPTPFTLTLIRVPIFEHPGRRIHQRAADPTVFKLQLLVRDIVMPILGQGIAIHKLILGLAPMPIDGY